MLCVGGGGTKRFNTSIPAVTRPNTVKPPFTWSRNALFVRFRNHCELAESFPLPRAMAIVPLVLLNVRPTLYSFVIWPNGWIGTIFKPFVVFVTWYPPP